MKIRHPLLIRLLAVFAAWLIRFWMGTLRFRTTMWDEVRHPADPDGQRYIYAFWHETILFPTTFRTRIHALISQHADGELIARVCQHLGCGTVRGSKTRGGARALIDMNQVSQEAHLLFTPDGPRGPRRRVHIGLIFTASMTGLPIIPVGVAYADCWRARSWDRFALPKPGSLAYGIAGQAIQVPAELNRVSMEHYRQLVEERLLEVTAAAEEWARTSSVTAPLPPATGSGPEHRRAA